VKDARNSTKVQISSSTILAWLTSAKYDSMWKGTAKGFISYWMNKIRKYDTFTYNEEDHFSDTQKLQMLQNAVVDAPELRQVRMNAELEVAKGGSHLNYYDQYVALRLWAANALDHDNTGKHTPKKQHVFCSETNDGQYEINAAAFSAFDDDDDESYNVDTFLTNVTLRSPPIQARKQRIHQSNSSRRPYLPAEAWNKIPKDVQALLLGKKPSSASPRSSPTDSIELSIFPTLV
jgi:hypothetical protein